MVSNHHLNHPSIRPSVRLSLLCIIVMFYLILSIGQIHSNSDSFIKFLWSHDPRKPRGAHVLIIDVTEWMGIKVES